MAQNKEHLSVFDPEINIPVSIIPNVMYRMLPTAYDNTSKLLQHTVLKKFKTVKALGDRPWRTSGRSIEPLLDA